MSVADESLLVSLAHLCPSKDGAIVYQARALRAYKEASVFNYPDDCSNIFASRDASSGGVGNFIPNKWNVGIYPNPNSGSFSIVSKLQSEALQISLCDISGKQLLNASIVTENFVYLLDLNLQNGVYIVSIKNNQNETVTKKVVVSK